MEVGCNKVVQNFIDVHHTSSVKLTDEKPSLIVEVVCVLLSMKYPVMWKRQQMTFTS